MRPAGSPIAAIALVLSVGWMSIGCTAQAPPVAPPPAPAPVTEEVAKPKPDDPFAPPASFRDEQLGPEPVTSVAALPPRPRDVPPVPASCGPLPLAGPAPACETPEKALSALADALDAPDEKTRAMRLASLEGCALPPGLITALRSDLGPTVCADALLEPYFSSAKIAEVSVELRGAMVGMVFAAWASRAVTGVPALRPPHTKARVLEHIKGPGLRWVQTQSGVLDDLTKQAVKLPLYGRAIAAVEVGSAYLRFVEGIRSLPIPDEYKNDRELADAYFGSLDQLFDPQKRAGRDAALVGLRDFAVVGAIDDPRVSRARQLLKTVYGGKRVDALDALVLETRPAAAPSTVHGRLSHKLPTFFAGVLLPAPTGEADAQVLAGFARRGVPLSHRKALQESGKITGDAATSLAVARFALGQRYWRALDFDQSLKAAAGSTLPPRSLLPALALALRGGPDGAAEVVKRLSSGSLGTFDLRALDAVARENPTGLLGAAAAFNAAYILEISPPAEPDAAFYRDLAGRYRDAAKRDPALTTPATARALNAELLAKDLAPAK